MVKKLLPLLVLSGCLDLVLPQPPPDPGPGSLQGSLVYSEPGQSTLRPAVGAVVELVGSGVRTVSAGDTGFFTLSPVDTNVGAVLIRFDSDGDGKPDRQRLLQLEPLHTGRGKVVNVGQVAVGSNATIKGKALRGDLAPATSGHGGTAVFVPEGPFFSYTADDGSFLFENLPEGRVTVAVFRDGYRSLSESIELRAAEIFPLRELTLTRETGPANADIRGRVLLPEGGAAADVKVTMSSGRSTTTDAQGAYSFSRVPHGVYSVGFVKEGFKTAELINIVIGAPVVTLRDVTLAPGSSTMPLLDGGLAPYDAGVDAGVDAGIDAGVDAGIDAGVDAGIDAGVDAGIDAGADAGIDAGVDAGIDAGVDAGIDAGVDAGIDAGVDAGIDAGVDAGIDAGPWPVAIIDPPPAFVLRNTTFQLNAQRSTGNRPLIFNWAQDAGLTATFAQNNSVNAATPNITAPGAVSLLKLNLSVRDLNGRDSETVSVFVPVAIGPPVATITGTPTVPMLGGQRVVLSGASSSDPNTSGLVSWEWTVTPTNVVTATPLNGGQQLQLDMPASVSTPVVISVQLVVTNGLTMRSAPASTTFQLALGAAPQWYVDAGPFQTVNGGSIVTLAGGAVAPSTGASFTYEWSPSREPDAGIADFLLTSPTSASTTFVAPRVDGPLPRTINFTLTATDTTGTLTPPVRTAQTLVNVLDRRAPVLLTTSVSGGTGPMSTVWADFDEDVSPTNLNSVNISWPSGSPAVSTVNRVVLNKRRVQISMRPPATPGFVYVFNVGGVTDFAGNVITSSSFNFIVSNSWSPAFESASVSTGEPWPGLVVRRTVDNGYEAFPFGRKDSAAWFFQPVDPFGCATLPCTLVDETGPVIALTGPRPRGHKGWLVNDDPIATLQVADLQGTPAAIYRHTDAGWSPVPAPPNAVFSDNKVLSSVLFEDGGVRHVVLDGGGWSVMSTITTNLTEFPTDSASDPFVFGNASLNARPMVLLKSSKSDTIRASMADPGWAAPTALGAALEARAVTMVPEYPTTSFNLTLRANGNLDMACIGLNCGANFLSGVSSFDALSNYASYWFATVTSGQLELRYQQYGIGPTAFRMVGPLRGGMPAFSLNNDTSCEAARPELAGADGQLFITWQERCGAGPWRVYLRALQ